MPSTYLGTGSSPLTAAAMLDALIGGRTSLTLGPCAAHGVAVPMRG